MISADRGKPNYAKIECSVHLVRLQQFCLIISGIIN